MLRLETVDAGDLAQPQQPLRQGAGRAAGLIAQVLGRFLGGERRTDVNGAVPLGGEAVGMGHQLRVKPWIARQQEPQTAGVVIVAVRQGDVGQAGQVDAHFLGVGQKDVRIAGVQQHPRAAVLYVVTDGRLAQIVLIDIGVVVHQNGELHGPFLLA